MITQQVRSNILVTAFIKQGLVHIFCENIPCQIWDFLVDKMLKLGKNVDNKNQFLIKKNHMLWITNGKAEIISMIQLHNGFI